MTPAEIEVVMKAANIVFSGLFIVAISFVTGCSIIAVAIHGLHP